MYKGLSELHNFSDMKFIVLCYSECSWKGHDCVLNIHWEDGFTLYDAKPSRQSKQDLRLWYFPFERLKGSGDDNKHSLWLNFGGDEGRQVRTWNS
jgi:hypothetical protein